MLNGFGDAHEIEFARAELQRQYGVKVRYSGRRHEPTRTDPRDGPNSPAPSSARSTSSSTTPESSTSRRSKSFPEEKWDAVMAINLSSAFHLIKGPSWPEMKAPLRRFRPHHQHIASAHGLTASPFKGLHTCPRNTA